MIPFTIFINPEVPIMTRIQPLTLTALLLVLACAAHAEETKSPATQPSSTPLSGVVKDIDGKDFDLSQLRGKAVMVVNVASKCGQTPQYTGLQKLYDTYKDRGFVVIGFPANNFKEQEPGTDAEIKEFCSTKYNVTFPVMSKISVKGDDQHPVYRSLTDPSTAGAHAGEIGWNFTKFLIGKDGRIAARFNTKIKPEEPQVSEAIEKALAAPGPTASAGQ